MSNEKGLDPAKQQTQRQWNLTPCGTGDFLRDIEPESVAYFDAIRYQRYQVTDPWMLQKVPFAAAAGKRLLEIGHGIGSDLLTFAEAGAEVHGVDITPEHHRLAQRNFAVHGMPVDLRLGDAANLDYPSDHFDVVYSHGVLHHTPDTMRCIGEAYRVLKPGGLLIMSVYRRFSAFHLVAKLLVDGVRRRRLFTLGYDGLMATVERGADGRTIKPLVKTYTGRQVRGLLKDFSSVEVSVAHFSRDHLSVLAPLLPRSMEKLLEPALGWYLLAFATK